MTQLQASFGKPFKFQVAAFRLRLAELKATTGWDKEVWQAEHDRAFMVAGAIRADILADLGAAVDKAISQGSTLETFRKDFRKIVAEKGWQISPAGQGTKGGEAWRTKVIYKTNLSTSYAAGRFAQLTQAGYPFLVYRHGAAVEPRVQHLAWDGLVLPADHPFWKTHCPPNGWGCTCYITGARSKESARRVGGDPAKTLPEGWQSPDPRTGAPKGIDRGWAYAPGATVAQTVAALAPRLEALPAGPSVDLIQDWLKSAAFSNWYSAPNGSWPVARLGEVDAGLIGADNRIAVLAADDAIALATKRPDLSAAYLGLIQSVIDEASSKESIAAGRMVFLRELPADASKVMLVYLRAESGRLFVTDIKIVAKPAADALRLAGW